jgi:hypothetical protein
MQERFSTARKDIETREDHWHRSLALLEGSWQDWLLGLGLGGFPRAYVLSTDPGSRVGTYLYRQEAGNTFLRLGGGNDLNLGQRIEISPHKRGPLRFSGILRTDGKIRKFGGSICRRRLLEQQAYNRTCTYFSVRIEGQAQTWQSFSREIEIKKDLKDDGWTDPRVTLFRLSNGTQGTLLDLDNLALRGTMGLNYLHNGDFSAGGDRWFSYNDFEHLPWHAKNLYLAILIDQGLLGLTGFLALNALAVRRAWQPARTGDPLAIGSIAMMAGWLTLGAVATLVDVPRNTFLYFLVLLAVGSASGLPRTGRKQTGAARHPTRQDRVMPEAPTASRNPEYRASRLQGPTD